MLTSVAMRSRKRIGISNVYTITASPRLFQIYDTRTAEGRCRAQKRGQRMGRPPKLTDAQQDEARRRRAEGATLAELARSYGVGKSMISRLAAV